MSDQQFDERDKDLDGFEDAESLTEQADQDQTYGEVTAEDLGTEDLIDDGADLATALNASEAGAGGPIPVDEEIIVDEPGEETIEDRIRQEEPDPTSAIVPPDADPLIRG